MAYPHPFLRWAGTGVPVGSNVQLGFAAPDRGGLGDLIGNDGFPRLSSTWNRGQHITSVFRGNPSENRPAVFSWQPHSHVPCNELAWYHRPASSV